MIATSKHCTPAAATTVVEAYRKVDGNFQCLSRFDNTYPQIPSAYPADSVVDLRNTVCQGQRVNVNVARHPDTGDTTSDDLAVLMPIKASSNNWVDSGAPGSVQNIGIAVNFTSSLMAMISFGNARDSSGSAGELRAGIFLRNWADGKHMVYKASNDYQTCSGDSGAPLFTSNGVDPAHYAVVHSSSDRSDACADPGSKQRGSQLGGKVPWIRSVTGRVCPELGTPSGGIGAYCFAR